MFVNKVMKNWQTAVTFNTNQKIQNELEKAASSNAAEDEWDSDPNFVNNISEKDQRWGMQKTVQDNTQRENVEMEKLREQVKNAHHEKALKEWEPKKSIQPKMK
jgi:hypothetical protein